MFIHFGFIREGHGGPCKNDRAGDRQGRQAVVGVFKNVFHSLESNVVVDCSYISEVIDHDRLSSAFPEHYRFVSLESPGIGWGM
jgi:hypothetical protein